MLGWQSLLSSNSPGSWNAPGLCCFQQLSTSGDHFPPRTSVTGMRAFQSKGHPPTIICSFLDGCHPPTGHNCFSNTFVKPPSHAYKCLCLATMFPRMCNHGGKRSNSITLLLLFLSHSVQHGCESCWSFTEKYTSSDHSSPPSFKPHLSPLSWFAVLAP